jgi:carbamoyl-phosphate synthase large subunit
MPPGSPVAVKEVTLPWSRFRTIGDTAMTVELGPEMRSTGEVMGIDESFGAAFAKSQAAVSVPLPMTGRVLVSVADRDIRAVLFGVRMLVDLGFGTVATRHTAPALNRAGILAPVVAGPPARGIAAGEIDLVISTHHADTGRAENLAIRAAAITHRVPYLTTVQALTAAVQGIASLGEPPTEVRSLQEYGRRLAAKRAGR